MLLPLEVPMIRNLIVMGALATLLPTLHAQPVSQETQRSSDMDDGQGYAGESPERYVQVRAIEGQATVRKGELTEDLTRGVPLTEGDIIEARGRGVLQLADGSRIVFGEGARFTLASLFADRDNVRQVVLRLDRGHLRLQVGTQSTATFRIDTPSGRGTLQDRANASFEVDGDQSVRVKVFTGRIRFANSQDRTQLAAGERLTVYSGQDRLDRIRDFNTYEMEGFDTWADRQFQVTRGTSFDRLPAQLRAYGEDLDRDGEWVEVDEVGWCWRPRGVVADWRPYWQGRWGAYATGMTWVSEEPWGYVTHHHGRWGWHARLGWHWIPGALYSPAWVAWRTVDAMFGWAPLGYWNRPVHWGYSHWNGGYCWNVVSFDHMHHHRLHTRIHNDVRIIRPFNDGPRDNGGRGSSRLTPPWQQTPLLLQPRELRDPAMIRAVVNQPEQQRTRLAQVVRDNPGRLIMTRDVDRPREIRSGDSGAPSARVPFNRSEPPPQGRTPLLREPSVLATPRGEDRPNPRQRDMGADRPGRPSERDIHVAPGGESEPRLRPRPDGLRRTEDAGPSRRNEDRSSDVRREVRSESPRREVRSEEPRREIRSEAPRRETRSEEPRRETRSEAPRRETAPPRSDPPRSAEPSRSAPPRSDPPKRDRG